MAPEAVPLPRRPLPLGRRGVVLLAILLAGLWAAITVDLAPAQLIPSEGGLRLAGRFFSAALAPALTWEGAFVPQGAAPLLLETLRALGRTVVFAAAGMMLALVLGIVLGFLGSTAWWAEEAVGGTTAVGRVLRRTVLPAVYGVVRVVIALMRSVHELLWAVLFLAAFGFHPATAIVAIAIPYGGTLAKIFSEMADEAPRDAAYALRGLGATDLQVFGFGLLPRALPDMAAYTFYRFECALRSSAILGFFGFETLGLYIRESFNNAYYGEVWTFLYGLFLLVVVVEWWSGALRRPVSR